MTIETQEYERVKCPLSLRKLFSQNDINCVDTDSDNDIITPSLVKILN